MWSLGWAGDLLWDIRYAIRRFRQSPAFTVVALAMLALGIGVNAMVFTITNAVVFKGFPLVRDNDRLLYITMGPRGGCCVSYPDFLDWRDQAKSFQGMAIVRGTRVSMSDAGGLPEQLDATEVSVGIFDLVGQKPLLGRDFVLSDENYGAPSVALLQYSYWQDRFGGSMAIVGHSVRINGAPATIIGVMPPGFAFPQKQELWVPMVRTPRLSRREARDTWMVIARLAPRATRVSARAEMESIGKRLAAAYPLTNQGQLPIVQNFTEFYIGNNAIVLYAALWGAVGFVLLIACSNLANLLLGRALMRSREISLRMALGASRWRIMRQLFIESLILSACGGFFGWWIAQWGTSAYVQTLAVWLRPFFDSSTDGRVLWYLIAVSLSTGLLFGLVPALSLSKLDVNTTLKTASRTTTQRSGKRLSRLLVIAEVALATILLVGAGIMLRSFLNLYTANLGIDARNVLAATVSAPASKYPDGPAQAAFYERLAAQLEAVPGIDSVALANFRPTGGSVRMPYELGGAEPVDQLRRPQLSALVISFGYFRTLGARILSGRDFTDSDGPTGSPVAIVNELMANKFWPNQDPLGKRLRFFDTKGAGSWITVVGVSSNILQDGATQNQMAPLIYLPFLQNPRAGMTVLIHTRLPSGDLAKTIQYEISAVDSDLITYSVWILNDYLRLNYHSKGLSAGLFLMLAATGLLLACMGIYAVVAQAVSRQVQEIGIRLAMGASVRDIIGLVFGQGMVPLGVGLTIGLAGSLAVNQVLKSEVAQASSIDPATLGIAAAVLLTSALLGCWIPARRALRVDPVVALRNE